MYFMVHCDMNYSALYAKSHALLNKHVGLIAHIQGLFPMKSQKKGYCYSVIADSYFLLFPSFQLAFKVSLRQIGLQTVFTGQFPFLMWELLPLICWSFCM